MERAIATPVSVLQSYAEVNRRRAEEYEYHKVYASLRSTSSGQKLLTFSVLLLRGAAEA